MVTDGGVAGGDRAVRRLHHAETLPFDRLRADCRRGGVESRLAITGADMQRIGSSQRGLAVAWKIGGRYERLEDETRHALRS